MSQDSQPVQYIEVNKIIELSSAITNNSTHLTWRIGCYCCDCNAARDKHLLSMDLKKISYSNIVAYIP